MIEIIEEFSCSKTGVGLHNEDGIFKNDHFIAVIDGATSKTDIVMDGRTTGQFIRDVIMDALGGMVGGESCRDAIRIIQERISYKAAAASVSNASASAIIYSIAAKELWSIGDCQAYINSRLIRKTKRVDRVLSEVRSLAIEALLASGTPYQNLLENDKGRELILPFLRLQHVFENKGGKYGYSNFNVDGHPENIKAKIYKVESGDMVVLASDGYPNLWTTLAESERQLSAVLDEDPLMIGKYATTKGVKKGNVSFDDRTYIRFVAE